MTKKTVKLPKPTPKGTGARPTLGTKATKKSGKC
jgi:hypothetical protein